MEATHLFSRFFFQTNGESHDHKIPEYLGYFNALQKASSAAYWRSRNTLFAWQFHFAAVWTPRRRGKMLASYANWDGTQLLVEVKRHQAMDYNANHT